MNIIPSTFNSQQIQRTVIGGTQVQKDYKMNISVIMLNDSGSHLRIQTIETLLNCGFKSIVWAEPAKDSFNIEDVSRRFPSVKFVIPLEKTTDGALINVCASELDAEYFLVLRGNLKIPANLLLQNVAENLTRDKRYCIMPRLIDKNGQSIPVNIVPESKKGHFLLSPIEFIGDGVPTMYNTDFIGLFNREKFIQLGGYDHTIVSPYWQNADLSLRAWLWGEKITISTAFSISYEHEKEIEDTTRDNSYLLFYLKNILPKFKNDHGVIRSASFFKFKLFSTCGFFEAFSLFKNAKNWVNLNKYRFKTDIHALTETWASKK